MPIEVVNGCLAVSAIKREAAFLRKAQTEDKEFLNLQASIAVHGVITPVLVYLDSTTDEWQLFEGMQRVSAAELIDPNHLVPVSIRSQPSKPEILAIQIAANADRVPTRPAMYAAAIQSHLTENPGLTKKEVAEVFGRSPAWIDQILKILKLDKNIQALVDNGNITVDNALQLLRLPADARDAHLLAAQTSKTSEFAATVQAFNDAARKGAKTGSEEFQPAPRARAVTDIQGMINTPNKLALLASTATSLEAAVALGLMWAISLDPETVAAKKKALDDAKAERLKAANDGKAVTAMASKIAADKTAAAVLGSKTQTELDAIEAKAKEMLAKKQVRSPAAAS